jgi:hypothetical protein
MDGDKRFRCPRRSEIGGAGVGGPFKLGFDEATPDAWRADGTCSYCGSITPESLLAQVATGIELGPTDKNYKVYVGRHLSGKFYFQHLNPTQCLEFIALHNDNTMKLGFPGYFYVPPFFMRRL